MLYLVVYLISFSNRSLCRQVRFWTSFFLFGNNINTQYFSSLSIIYVYCSVFLGFFSPVFIQALFSFDQMVFHSGPGGPLGHLLCRGLSQCPFFVFPTRWLWWGLNPRPSDYQADVLPPDHPAPLECSRFLTQNRDL